MKNIFRLMLSGLSIVSIVSCHGQSKTGEHDTADTIKIVGGSFENRDFTYHKMPGTVSARDTSPAWHEPGERLLLTGTIYKPDGKTPAAGVLLYYYHTNSEGKYLHKPNEKRSMAPNKLGQSHGFIRGWVKSDSQGKYFIYTVKPGTYPSRDAPAHVHVTIKEPGDISEYYIDDFVFDDDTLLNATYRNNMEMRGGSGVLHVTEKDGLLIGERNITLGLHIPGYPEVHSDNEQE